MPRKNLAKMAAAYKACKELHRIRELDDDLLPVQSLSDEDSESEEEETGSDGKRKAKAGTKKRKQVYKRKVSDKSLSLLFCFRRATNVAHIFGRVFLRYIERFFRICVSSAIACTLALCLVRNARICAQGGRDSLNLGAHWISGISRPCGPVNDIANAFNASGYLFCLFWN